MTDIHPEDFLDSATSYAATDATGAAETTPSGGRRRLPVAATTAGWLVAGLVIGGVGVAAWHSSNTTTTLTGNPAAGTAPGGLAGFAPGPGGGRSGEQHLVGTLSAVGSSSITLTTTSGTATYTIDASTLLVKDGQRISSLASMHSGDPVVVHVYPLNGSTHVEMVLDGAPPTGFGTTTTHI